MGLMRGSDKERCDHPDQSATVYCGLERTQCNGCGQIFIRAVDQGQPGVLFQDRRHARPLVTTNGYERKQIQQ